MNFLGNIFSQKKSTISTVTGTGFSSPYNVRKMMTLFGKSERGNWQLNPKESYQRND